VERTKIEAKIEIEIKIKIEARTKISFWLRHPLLCGQSFCFSR